MKANSFPSIANTIGKEDWTKEWVNGTHSHMIKGLKPGMSYKVRVVATDEAERMHSSKEVPVTVPGEAACLTVDGFFPFLLFFSFVSII